MGHDKFNANFYITVGTVIPVLFLALTLQGSTLNDMLDRWKATGEALARGEVKSQWSLATKSLAAGVLLTAIGTILVAGFAGEFLAIKALYYQSPSLTTEAWVFIAAIALLILVVAGPLLKFLAMYGRFAWFVANELVPDKPPAKAGNEENKT